MKEFWQDVYNEVDGITLRVKLRDDIFDYVKYRNILSEKICIALINELKKKFSKKAAVIYGNCQTRQLRMLLLSNPTFYKNYFFIQIPEVCNYNENILHCFQESFWSETDLFISQRIGEKNRFSPVLATDNVSIKLQKNTKIVWIPNVYFDGYFPQHKQDPRYLQNARDVGKAIPQDVRMNGDKYVDKFLTERIGGGVQKFLNSSILLNGKTLFLKKKF